MFKSGLDKVCSGLKLPCVPQLGDYDGGGDYKLAETLAAVKFLKEPHRLVPDIGFDMLMRRDGVEDVEVVLAVYDLQNLRDRLWSQRREFEVNVLFHAWLFPDLLFRGEENLMVEAGIFQNDGVFPIEDRKEGMLRTRLRKFEQKVWVKDKVYMCMGPDTVRIRIDPHRPVCWFWSVCIPEGRDTALVTKHVLLCETRTHITKEIRGAMTVLQEGAAVTQILKHLEKLLTSVQAASQRLARLMAKCESAYEGVPLDEGYLPMHGSLGDPNTQVFDPRKVWEGQLAGLDGTAVLPGGTADQVEGGPRLAEMIRRRVFLDLYRALQQKENGATNTANNNAGNKKKKSEVVRPSGRTRDEEDQMVASGALLFEDPKTSDVEKAKSIHRILLGLVHDFEYLAESNAEILAVEGVTA